jgi:hypothetical protein
MIAKLSTDLFDNLLGDGVWRKFQGVFTKQVELGSFTIVGVIVRLATFELIALHQKPRFVAHKAIEMLHPQTFTPLGSCRKNAREDKNRMSSSSVKRGARPARAPLNRQSPALVTTS